MNSSQVKPQQTDDSFPPNLADDSLAEQATFLDFNRFNEPSETLLLPDSNIGIKPGSEMRFEQESNFTSLFAEEAKLRDFQTELPSYDFTYGLNFAEQQLCYEKLKETVTPLDHSELVQVLTNPQQDGGYITVETITQNVFPVGGPLIKSVEKFERLEECDLCSQKLTKTQETDFCCFSCNEKKTSLFYKCISKECINKVGFDYRRCHFCHTQGFVGKMVEEKTRQHSKYLEQSVTLGEEIQISDLQTPKLTQLPSQRIYTYVRFWNQQNECQGRFHFDKKPALFGKKFIQVGELGELYYFFTDQEEKEFTFVEIDFQKIQQVEDNTQMICLGQLSKREQKGPNLLFSSYQKPRIFDHPFPRLFNDKLVWTTCVKRESNFEHNHRHQKLYDGMTTIVHDFSTSHQFCHPRCWIYFGVDTLGTVKILKESWKELRPEFSLILDQPILETQFDSISEEELLSEKHRVKETQEIQDMEQWDAEFIQIDYQYSGVDLYLKKEQHIVNIPRKETYESSKLRFKLSNSRETTQGKDFSVFYKGKLLKMEFSFEKKDLCIVTILSKDGSTQENGDKHVFQLSFAGIGRNFQVEEVLHFDLEQQSLKLLAHWQDTKQYYLAVVESAKNLLISPPHVLQVGQQNIICSYPLLVSQSLKVPNQVLITNLQLNSPQVCLDFGHQTVVGVGVQTSLFEFGETDKKGEFNIKYIYVLIKWDSRITKIYAFKVDCFGLETESSLNHADERPQFWSNKFQPRIGDLSKPYQTRVVEGFELKAGATRNDAQINQNNDQIDDLACSQFQSVFAQGCSNRYFLQTSEQVCSSLKSAIKMTVLVRRGKFSVEQSEEGDVLRFISWFGDRSSSTLHTFKGLKVIAIKLVNAETEQIQILTSDFKLHMSSSDGFSSNTSVKTVPQEWFDDKKEEFDDSQDEAKVNAFSCCERIVFFDEQICIFYSSKTKKFYQYVFSLQQLTIAFEKSLLCKRMYLGQECYYQKLVGGQIGDISEVSNTELIMITRVNQTGDKILQIVPVPNSRQVIPYVYDQYNWFEPEPIYFDFLPNDLSCFHKPGTFFVYCTTTCMMVYAEKKDIVFGEQKETIQVGDQTFYQKQNYWILGESIDNLLVKIQSSLSLAPGYIAAEKAVLKYSKENFYLARLTVRKSVPKQSKATFQTVKTKNLNDDIEIKCFDIEIFDEKYTKYTYDSSPQIEVTRNYLVVGYKDQIRAIKISGGSESSWGEIKEIKTRQGQSGHLSIYDPCDLKQLDPKNRPNVIQLHDLYNGYNLTIWDLDQDELVTAKPDMIGSGGKYTRIVFRLHETSNHSRTISFWYDEIETYYSRFDLERLLEFLSDPSKLETLLDESLLFANIGDRTLFSVLVRMTDPKFMKIVGVAVEKLFSEKQTVQSDTPQEHRDQAFLRDLYNILVMPCCVDTYPQENESVMAKYLNIANNLESREAKEKISVLQQALNLPDPTQLQSLIRLFIHSPSKCISLYDIVHDCEQFQQLINANCQQVNELLDICGKTTEESDKVTELQFPDSQERVSFTYNTPLLSSKEIQEIFALQIQAPTGLVGFISEIIILASKRYAIRPVIKSILNLLSRKPCSTSVTCKVQVLEIEWLEKHTAQFLQVVSNNDQNFDNKLVQNLLKEMNFWYPLFTFMFIPYMSYFGLVTYYFCFVLSDAYQPRTGFTDGGDFPIALRFLIMIYTGYQYFIEYLQLKEQGLREYFKLSNLKNHFQNFMRLLIVWIIVEHSTNFTKVDATRLAQVASLVQFLLWYYLLEWMRIFDGTAVYVRLVYDTVWNTRYFMIMLLIIICTFGSSFMILDRQAKLLKQYDGTQDSYVQIQTATMGYDVTDSFIYQFLVMYGNATQEGFETNPNRVLLWIYYIVAIFLTNVTFLNLLIAVMSTTYETVMETKDRGMLIERTRIYLQYIGALNAVYPAIQNKFNKRYMYIATKTQAEELGSIASVETSIASFKKDIRREVGDLKRLMEQCISDTNSLKIELQASQKLQSESIVKQIIQELNKGQGRAAEI